MFQLYVVLAFDQNFASIHHWLECPRKKETRCGVSYNLIDLSGVANPVACYIMVKSNL